MSYTYNHGNVTLNTAGGIAGSGTSTITLSNTTGSSFVIGSGGAGAAGQIYTTTGTNGASWVSPNTNFTSSNNKTIMSIPYGEDKVVLEKSATLEVKGNVVINGVDLEERLKTIEKILTIPERDVKLEKKHPKLKKLYDEYIAALGKYRTFEAIKGEDE